MEGNAHPRLSLAIIEGLKNQGFNQSEIARLFGVTRQAVSWHVRKYGGILTPRQKVLEHWPWIVPASLCFQAPYRRLRDHGEFVATGGAGMTDEKLVRLRGFYKFLRDEDCVVEFDPDIEPQAGVAGKGGFAYRPRRKNDRDLLIRVNDYTHLSDEGRMIWRFPPIDP
jgi:hypothetical protein